MEVSSLQVCQVSKEQPLCQVEPLKNIAIQTHIWKHMTYKQNYHQNPGNSVTKVSPFPFGLMEMNEQTLLLHCGAITHEDHGLHQQQAMTMGSMWSLATLTSASYVGAQSADPGKSLLKSLCRQRNARRTHNSDLELCQLTYSDSQRPRVSATSLPYSPISKASFEIREPLTKSSAIPTCPPSRRHRVPALQKNHSGYIS